MRFLINKPGRKARKRAARGGMASIRYKGKAASRSTWKASGFSRNKPKRKRRKLFGAALAAHNKKRSRTRTNPTRRKRRVISGGSMAKRRRRRATVKRRRRRHVAINPRRTRRRMRRNPRVRSRSRRRFRRNPSISGGNIMKVGIQGVKDAALILVGKAGTRAVSAMIPFGANTGIVGTIKQVAVGIGLGLVAYKALGADASRMVVAGGIVAPLETLVKSLNIPLVSANLGDATGAGGSMYAIGAPARMSAYPLAAYPGGQHDTGYGEY